jgi:NAD(P)-dependent dehydrogenase (short-subunit alcohol dehydrogenase family)
VQCDVTDDASVKKGFDKVVEHFGGVDIAISNAGAAWQGRIGEVSDEILRKSFELNFFAHQRVAQAATRIMLAQGTGGCLLFNVSKQAVNRDRISVLTACRKRRRCSSCGNTRSITAPTASAPMR